MMKKSLCLLFVLALIAQICAMPADHVDAEKDTATGLMDEAEKGARDATDKARKGASDTLDKATKGASDAMDKATKGATDGANKVTGATDEAENKGGHGVANHGGKDCHKPGTRYGPVTGAIKATEEVGKKVADASVNVVKDFLGIFGL